MSWGWHFCPFLPPLAPFLVLLTVALVGMAVPALARMKAAPTASSLEVCRVVISSSSLVVFGGSRPISWTKVRHIMPSQNDEMTSASATQGSSWHFVRNAEFNLKGIHPASAGSLSDHRGCPDACTCHGSCRWRSPGGHPNYLWCFLVDDLARPRRNQLNRLGGTRWWTDPRLLHPLYK
jgi:hypothetical protein